VSGAIVESKKLLHFNPDRGLGFDFSRDLQFSPNREMLFDPNRALGFDQDRDLEFGKRGPIFRGLVCPNCQSIVMIIEEYCPDCGTQVQSLGTVRARQKRAKPAKDGRYEVGPRAAMESRRLEQPPPQIPRQQPAPAPATQYSRSTPPKRATPSTAPPQAAQGPQVICPNCALQLPGQTVYCPRCGVNIQQWRSYLTQMSKGQPGSDPYKGRYRPPGR
jgi:RNA polymerase subunit RPABC4/transcription elongation factor Spt4